MAITGRSGINKTVRLTAVKIFGTELPELRRLAEQVKGVIQQVEGAVDVQPEQQEEKR